MKMARLGGLLGGFWTACGPVSAVERGQDLFSDSRLSSSPSNVFSCATCHAVTPARPAAQDSPRYAGYTLAGATKRPSFWGGGFQFLLDAVNFCHSQFMRGQPFTTSDPQGLALLAYLRSLPSESDAALPLTWVPNITPAYIAALPSGDSNRGALVYTATCALCHGQPHSGRGRLGSYISIIPDETIHGFGTQARAVIIEKIRHGKFFGISGNMPPYSSEALADSELGDLLAYLNVATK